MKLLNACQRAAQEALQSLSGASLTRSFISCQGHRSPSGRPLEPPKSLPGDPLEPPLKGLSGALSEHLWKPFRISPEVLMRPRRASRELLRSLFRRPASFHGDAPSQCPPCVRVHMPAIRSPFRRPASFHGDAPSQCPPCVRVHMPAVRVHTYLVYLPRI